MKVFCLMADRGVRERFLCVAAGFSDNPELAPGFARLVGLVTGGKKVRHVICFLVLNGNERRRVPCDLQRLRDHESNRLAAEMNLSVMQRSKRRAGRSDLVPVAPI